MRTGAAGHQTHCLECSHDPSMLRKELPLHSWPNSLVCRGVLAYLWGPEPLLGARQGVGPPQRAELVAQPVSVVLHEVLPVPSRVLKAHEHADGPLCRKGGRDGLRVKVIVHGHQDVCVRPEAGPGAGLAPGVVVLLPALDDGRHLRDIPEARQHGQAQFLTLLGKKLCCAVQRA